MPLILFRLEILNILRWGTFVRNLVFIWAIGLCVLGCLSYSAMAADQCDDAARRAAVATNHAALSSTDIKTKMDSPNLSRIVGQPYIDQCNGAHCTVYSVDVAWDDQWKVSRNFDVRILTASCPTSPLVIRVVDTQY